MFFTLISITLEFSLLLGKNIAFWNNFSNLQYSMLHKSKSLIILYLHIYSNNSFIYVCIFSPGNRMCPYISVENRLTCNSLY